MSSTVEKGASVVPVLPKTARRGRQTREEERLDLTKLTLATVDSGINVEA